MAVLNAEVVRLYAQRRPENVREKGSDSVRTSFAVQMYNEPFAKLARHPRLQPGGLYRAARFHSHRVSGG